MLVFERAQIAIDLREMLGELRLTSTQVLARCGDNGRAQPKTCGNLQRQTSSRRSVEELVCGRERLRIEAKCRCYDAAGGRRVRFERVIMARRHHCCAAPPKVVDHGNPERAAFDRVGSRS